jgi:hypothetical protein
MLLTNKSTSQFVLNYAVCGCCRGWNVTDFLLPTRLSVGSSSRQRLTCEHVHLCSIRVVCRTSSALVDHALHVIRHASTGWCVHIEQHVTDWCFHLVHTHVYALTSRHLFTQLFVTPMYSRVCVCVCDIHAHPSTSAHSQAVITIL